MNRVLLIHPGAMGDLIQALPAFERLRVRFSNDHLALLVGSPFGDMVRQWGLFDSVVAFDARTAYHGSRRARAMLFARLAWHLRRERFHAIATFKAAAAYGVLAFLAGAPVRVGLTRGVGGRFLTTRLAILPNEHREDRFLRVAAALDATEAAEGPSRWPVDGGALHAIRARRGAYLLGIAPGGARNVKEEMPQRRWPTARYVELCVQVLAAYEDAHIVVLGGGADRADADLLVRRLPADRVTNLAGATSISGAREVIAACRLFVTHDSGLLHLAGTTLTPLIGIFGPTAPSVVCPRRAGVVSLWRPARAVACHDEITGRVDCGIESCCMERCTVDEVFGQVQAIVESALAR